MKKKAYTEEIDLDSLSSEDKRLWRAVCVLLGLNSDPRVIEIGDHGLIFSTTLQKEGEWDAQTFKRLKTLEVRWIECLFLVPVVTQSGYGKWPRLVYRKFDEAIEILENRNDVIKVRKRYPVNIALPNLGTSFFS